jgi:cysteinyl-tRNA synthetase
MIAHVKPETKRIEGLIDQRNAARKAKNYKESDRIRGELKAMSIELEDMTDGTTIWKVGDECSKPFG